jgi:hypothetical protein
MKHIKNFESFLNESDVYFVVKNISSGEYEVKKGSKHSTTSVTGTKRFKSKEEAQTEADKLNK